MRKRIEMSKEVLKKNAMISCMILFSVIGYMIGLLLVNNKQSWTIGILFGLVFAILKLKLMENAFRKALQMPEAKAQKYASSQYMLRYVLTALLLVIAALQSTTLLFGTFIGLMSMKAGAYMQLAINKHGSKEKKL